MADPSTSDPAIMPSSLERALHRLSERGLSRAALAAKVNLPEEVVAQYVGVEMQSDEGELYS